MPTFIISDTVREKLKVKHIVGEKEIEQCFENPNKVVKVQLRKLLNNQKDFYWTEWEFSVFRDPNNQIIGIICLGIDITENKQQFIDIQQQEYILHAIYQSTTEASTFIDKNLIIRYNNQVAKDITKQIFGKEAQPGENSLDYFLPEYQEEFREIYEKALLGISTSVERTDGVNWWQIAVYPVYDKENNIFGIANNVQDITDRKQKELAILQQNEAFKAIAWQHSHELRRPIVNILGLCELLRKHKKETEELKDDYIDYLYEATSKLDQIVNKIVLQANKSKYLNNK